MTLNTAPPWRQLAEHLRRPSLFQLPAEQCQQCQEALPRFIADELANLPVDELYPETAVHLDICPACLPEYEALVHLAMAAFYPDEELK
jgi:hypothetical protein